MTKRCSIRLVAPMRRPEKGEGSGSREAVGALVSYQIGADPKLKSILRSVSDFDTAAVDHVRGRFCVVVEPSAGHFRTRIYMTLAAAERAAERAVAGGHEVTVILSCIDPVSVVVPGRRWSA